MTAAPEPEGKQADGVAPVLRFLGLVMFLLPIAGILAHAAIYLLMSPEWMATYLRGTAGKVVAGVAFLNLVGNWLHYRRTRMRLDVFSRILTYLWIITIVLMVVHLTKSAAVQ